MNGWMAGLVAGWVHLLKNVVRFIQNLGDDVDCLTQKAEWYATHVMRVGEGAGGCGVVCAMCCRDTCAIEVLVLGRRPRRRREEDIGWKRCQEWPLMELMATLHRACVMDDMGYFDAPSLKREGINLPCLQSLPTNG